MKDRCGMQLNGEKPEYEYSYNHQNWYKSVEYETKNARENVGLFDLSAFSKYDLKGKMFIMSYKKFVQLTLKMIQEEQLTLKC